MATIISLYYGYFGSFAEFSANKEVALNLSLNLLSLSRITWIVILNIININLVLVSKDILCQHRRRMEYTISLFMYLCLY